MTVSIRIIREDAAGSKKVAVYTKDPKAEEADWNEFAILEHRGDDCIIAVHDNQIVEVKEAKS